MHMRRYPYTVTYPSDHPARSNPSIAIRRWHWLHDNIGLMGTDWAWEIPFESHEDLVFHFKTEEDRTLFVLTWG
jgi:hypothetical protein